MVLYFLEVKIKFPRNLIETTNNVNELKITFQIKSCICLMKFETLKILKSFKTLLAHLTY